ncbi:hypothetical protein DN745_05730 [Bradymonas sediminis]|uniref:Uncharacterized protein n=1 Tax=Bradymonas sediminis TaxID=1548548 RepID=A0A2Z4FJ53_9DELT|nr:hypothetical protein DN745_05730 [Bradymonas sediminis]
MSECPPKFLKEPVLKGRGEVHVRAVVADLMAEFGAPLWAEDAFRKFQTKKVAKRNWLRVVLVASWLLHDPWFRDYARIEGDTFAPRVLAWLRDDLKEFARLIAVEACVEMPDRREELARRCLAGLGLMPAGESPAQAENRLATLDSIAQHRILFDTKKRMERAERLRQKMKVQEDARRAAARASRE